MTTFYFSGSVIELPAIAVSTDVVSRDPTAWIGQYRTVQLTGNLDALRVHTRGKSFPDRPGSEEGGAWILIGNVVQTSSKLAASRSLPGKDAQSMVAFTHVSEVRVRRGTVLHVGLASKKSVGFVGEGGGFQAEYVAGPRFRLKLLEDNIWHNKAGSA